MASIAFLSIEIKGQNYGVETFRAADSGNKIVRLSKGDGTVYEVEEGIDRTTCDCPDYRRRHASLPYSDGCKHVKACVQFGWIANVMPWEAAQVGEAPAECGETGHWSEMNSMAAERAAIEQAEVAVAVEPVAEPVAIIETVAIIEPTVTIEQAAQREGDPIAAVITELIDELVSKTRGCSHACKELRDEQIEAANSAAVAQVTVAEPGIEHATDDLIGELVAVACSMRPARASKRDIDELVTELVTTLKTGKLEPAPPKPKTARRAGKRGRPAIETPGIDWHAYGRRHAAGESYRTLAREAGVKPTTFANRVKGLGYHSPSTKELVFA